MGGGEVMAVRSRGRSFSPQLTRERGVPMNTTTTTTTTTTTRGTGWPLAAAQPLGTRPNPTWAEWSAKQARQTARRQRYGDLPFSDRELARLAFLRWLYRAERVVP